MKTLFRFRLWAGLLLLAGAQCAVASTLTVVVSGVRNADGNVALAVFSSSEGFPKEDLKAVRRQVAPIGADGVARTVFGDLPAGVYAIAAFHDDDRSGKLETNFFGVPKKGYGFSNNPRPGLRAATFDEARFMVPDGESAVEIRLGY